MRRVIYLMAGIILVFSSCDKAFEDDQFRAYPEDPISLHLQAMPEFSDWVAILKKTNYFSTLNISSIQWTHFAVNNTALKQYAKDILGSENILDVDVERLKTIVAHHTIPNFKISARNMSGKINRRTGDKEYLTAGYDFSTDWRYIVNGEGNDVSTIIERDIDLPNGYLQILDRPILVSLETLWDVINGWQDENGNKTYSIFCEALVKTGLKEYVEKTDTVLTYGPEGEKKTMTVKQEKTILAVPDSVFKIYDINNYDELQAFIDEYSEGVTTDPASPSSYIRQYMEYHIIPKRMGYADMALFPLRPYDVDRISRLKRNTIHPMSTVPELVKGISIEDQISDIVFNPHETANNNTFVVVQRDQPASNGYIHVISNIGLKPKMMAFFPVEFELTDDIGFSWINFYQDPIELNVSPGTQTIYSGDISFLTWTTNSLSTRVWYANEWMPVSTDEDGDHTNRWKNYDALYFSLGNMDELYIKTPLLPATGNDRRLRVYAEKSNDPNTGGRYHGTLNRERILNNGNWRTGSQLGQWEAFRTGDRDIDGTITFTVSDTQGEAGIDRIYFIPAEGNGTPVPENGWYNFDNN